MVKQKAVLRFSLVITTLMDAVEIESGNEREWFGGSP